MWMNQLTIYNRSPKGYVVIVSDGREIEVRTKDELLEVINELVEEKP